ncbi:hypothetical protein [Pandoraea communis]|uniref:hypothetical protein n=1 Tax=Pandoraea communis TaxID=2508297 RepID=UPI001240B71F|nr:hypothetical protein [Pandoraea communis]MDM8358088.1 hypothetical protein [Pandoraea communis]
MRDKEVIPTYFGFEIDSELGKKTTDKSAQFRGFLQQIGQHRRQDYVTFLAPTVLTGISATTEKQASPGRGSKPAGDNGRIPALSSDRSRT